MSNLQREEYRTAFKNDCLLFNEGKVCAINKRVLITISTNKTNASLTVFQKNIRKLCAKLNRVIYGRKFHREGINKITFHTFFEHSNCKRLLHSHIFIRTPTNRMLENNEWININKIVIHLKRLSREMGMECDVKNNRPSINYCSKQYHPYYNDNYQIY